MKDYNRNKYTNSNTGGSNVIRSSGPRNAYGISKTPSTKKLYRGGPNPISKEDRREELREQAEDRKEMRHRRTPLEQIQMLDYRLGVNVGAKRERERLQKLIG
jgi:hypothetical protein